MWIFTKNEFLSVVQHRDKPDHLMIRYRSVEQAEACTLPGEVSITPTADYIARKVVSKDVFKQWMTEQVDHLDYDNYKNAAYSTLMHKVPLMSVWGTMHQWQETNG
jgi:hypothetical protein